MAELPAAPLDTPSNPSGSSDPSTSPVLPEPVDTFADLGLPEPLLRSLAELGYETPTAVQVRTVPALLAGRDVLAHAPTGTGKTAAFALPILARLHAGAGASESAGADRRNGAGVRALVLTPTRELAIQVAEAFNRYARALPRAGALAIYGGQDYAIQLRALARGVQVVVGTPGRVADHLRRGTLTLGGLQTLVLDEADEMLRMGFVDEVEKILEQTPPERQTALFSATMPPPIRRIAKRHMNAPEEIGVEGRRSAAATIRQRVWTSGGGTEKLEALTRILEVEPFDAMLVFVRTKNATVELAEALEARGFPAAAMNGDMPQKERERQVERLRSGAIDLLIATDVVARGLDVERIGHVVNYDIPYDTEAYVHRVGRTGRAGRAGEAILFVAPRERRLLGAIERATGQRIEPLALPSVAEVNERRVAAFEARVGEVLAAGDLGFLETLVERCAAGQDASMTRVAAALARIAIGERPLLLEERAVHAKGKRKVKESPSSERRAERKPAEPVRHEPAAAGRSAAADRPAPTGRSVRAAPTGSDGTADTVAQSGSTGQSGQAETAASIRPDSRGGRDAPRPPATKVPMERFRVEVGNEHGVRAADLVGAIANEADIGSELIGRIDIAGDHSVVELPEGMPKFMLKELRRVWVRGRRLGITRLEASGGGGGARVPSGAGAGAPASPRDGAKGSAGGEAKGGSRDGPGGGPGGGLKSGPRGGPQASGKGAAPKGKRMGGSAPPRKRTKPP